MLCGVSGGQEAPSLPGSGVCRLMSASPRVFSTGWTVSPSVHWGSGATDAPDISAFWRTRSLSASGSRPAWGTEDPVTQNFKNEVLLVSSPATPRLAYLRPGLLSNCTFSLPSLIKNPAERADLKLLTVSGGVSWARAWGCLRPWTGKCTRPESWQSATTSGGEVRVCFDGHLLLLRGQVLLSYHGLRPHVRLGIV